MSGLAEAFNDHATKTGFATLSHRAEMDHFSAERHAMNHGDAANNDKYKHDHRHFPHANLPDLGANGIHVDPSINPPNINVVIAAANEMPDPSIVKIEDKPLNERTVVDVINDAAAHDANRIAARKPSLNPGRSTGGGMMA